MNNSPTALIADDEPLLRHHLNNMLAEVWPELDIVAMVQDGDTALSEVELKQPDIVFLDIRMPGLDGMSLAKQLNKMASTPRIVFITAYDEYAVKAFEQNAVDYLLKPIDEERLFKACQRLKQQLQQDGAGSDPNISALLSQLQQYQAPAEPQYLSWIKASHGDEIHLVATDEVLYFKAEDKYVSVFKRQGSSKEELLIRTSLKELLHKLDPQQFWQIHRSVVVNVSAIEKVKKSISGQMQVMIGDEKLAVSRSAQALFKSL